LLGLRDSTVALDLDCALALRLRLEGSPDAGEVLEAFIKGLRPGGAEEDYNSDG
jgi:hypothetical protein